MTHPSPGPAPTFDPSGYATPAPVWSHDAALDRVLTAGRGTAVADVDGQQCALKENS